MTISPMWYGDTLSLLVTVYNNSLTGTPFDLTNATLAAAAIFNGQKITGTAAIQGAPTAGQVLITFPAKALPPVSGTVQLRITSGGSIQTVYEDTLIVKASAFP